MSYQVTKREQSSVKPDFGEELDAYLGNSFNYTLLKNIRQLRTKQHPFPHQF